MRPEDFEGVVDGRRTRLFVLRRGDMRMAACNLGAKILQLVVPDRGGRPGDVVLGYPSLQALLHGQWAMGAFVGRYANRIANARFVLDGIEHRLRPFNGPHCLHGGPRGSFARVFDAEQPDDATLDLAYRFADGEEGFPGTVDLHVRYALLDERVLSVRYEAHALDKATVVNLTTHAFFNLAGHAAPDILGQALEIRASRFLPVDATLIPTGELRPVAGTAFDFRASKPIGRDIEAADPQLRHGRGYDHHFVLDRQGNGLALAARLADPASGRVMETWTTEPGLQLYSGNFLDGSRPRDVGKGGVVYGFRAALCLEPSRFPDAPNQPNFPSTVLRPGERYAGETQYRFF